MESFALRITCAKCGYEFHSPEEETLESEDGIVLVLMNPRHDCEPAEVEGVPA